MGLPESQNSAEPGIWSSISQKENIIAAQGYFLWKQSQFTVDFPRILSSEIHRILGDVCGLLPSGTNLFLLITTIWKDYWEGFLLANYQPPASPQPFSELHIGVKSSCTSHFWKYYMCEVTFPKSAAFCLFKPFCIFFFFILFSFMPCMGIKELLLSCLGSFHDKTTSVYTK